MGLPDLTTALDSRLRGLHEAIVDDLGQTFGADVVKAHSAEVTPGTVERFLMGKFAVWAVLGSADGLTESLAGELRMNVRWGVFIVASPVNEAVDGDPKRTRQVPAVKVAETIANYVVRLANQSRWGLDGCNGCPAASLSIRNLGVGIKSTQSFIEKEDLGLFVVWGSNELDVGPGILPGDEQLPLLEGVAGVIQDQARPEARPEVAFEQRRLAIFEWARRAWAWARRRVVGPSWPERAASVIKAEMEARFHAAV